jgi:hypothetical protein
MSQTNGTIQYQIKTAWIPIPANASHLLTNKDIDEGMKSWDLQGIEVSPAELGNLPRCYGLQRSGKKAACSSGKCYMYATTFRTVFVSEKDWPSVKLNMMNSRLHFAGYDRCNFTREQLEQEKADEAAAGGN